MDDEIICHAYTRARRHPYVIGVFGGWVSPFPLTPTQLGVLVGGIITAIVTHGTWGASVPNPMDLVVILGLPGAGAWAVRSLRVEGRPPWRFAAAWLGYVTRSRSGVSAATGRVLRSPRPRQVKARAW